MTPRSWPMDEPVEIRFVHNDRNQRTLLGYRDGHGLIGYRCLSANGTALSVEDNVAQDPDVWLPRKAVPGWQMQVVSCLSGRPSNAIVEVI